MTQETMTRDDNHTLVGVFDHVYEAEQAINDLKIAGFTPEMISVITKDRTEQRELTEATGNEAGQGALTGSLGGGTLGAVLGWLLAGGTALIPGIGPVAAAGIFGATVAGALVGGTVGGIGGALAGAGVPEHEASEYEEHVKGGRTLLTVRAASGQMMAAAKDIFERHNATNTRYYEFEDRTKHVPAYTGSYVTDEQKLYPSDRSYSAAGAVPTTDSGSDTTANNQSINANARSATRDELAAVDDYAKPGDLSERGRSNYNSTTYTDDRSIDDISTLPDKDSDATPRRSM